jgi:type IV pilus assembly protein PilM
MKLPSLNTKVLSIDFGSSHIKVVEGQVSKKGLSILESFSVNLLKESYDDGKVLDSYTISELIKTSLKEKKITTQHVYCIINSSEIISREVTIPKVPEKEIASIIGYQLDDFLPIDPEEYIVQHVVIDTIRENEVEKLSILLIAIPKPMVLSHLKLLQDAGLKPQVLDFQGNTMAKLMGFNGMINDNYNTRDIIVACIDIGYDSSKLTVIKNGKIEVTRVLEPGAKNLYDNISSLFDYSLDENESEDKVREIEDINAGNEEFTDYYRLLNITKSTMSTLLENIETIFRYYRTRDMGNDINIIVLQGGLSNIKGLENLFSNYFNIPATVLSKLDKINFNGDLSKYSNAIGGLIRISEV